nr:NnrS family protein [Nitrosospira briensis]
MGYFANMVLGMASRVTLGHSGNLLALDKFTWLLFIAFQAVVLLRIFPDLLPDTFGTATMTLYLLAGLSWLICFTLWAVRHVPLYWRLRIDDKPG